MAKKTAPRRKRGRPYAGGETPKRYIRISDDDYAAIKRAAEATGQTTAEWMRSVLLKAAGRTS